MARQLSVLACLLLIALSVGCRTGAARPVPEPAAAGPDRQVGVVAAMQRFDRDRASVIVQLHEGVRIARGQELLVLDAGAVAGVLRIERLRGSVAQCRVVSWGTGSLRIQAPVHLPQRPTR
ncbi:MAG: hypothetical protein ACOCXJ_00720 [Planctomycetota bacterium]